MKKATMNAIGALLFSIVLSGMAVGQITIDGTSSEVNYTTLASYTSGNDGFGSTNNIDEINFYSDGTTIYVGIPADLDGNNNVVVWMNFSGYDGQDAGSVVGESGEQSVFGSGGMDGAAIDMEADYAFAFNEGSGTSNLFLDAARYGSTGIIFESGFIGQSDQSGNSATIPSSNITNLFDANSITMAYNNGGGTNQGIEFSIDVSKIAGVDSSNTVQIFAAIVSSGGFWSNEFIPSGSYTGGNLGDDGQVDDLTGDYFTTASSLQHTQEISGTAGWRLLSLPKTGGTVVDVSDDSPVQGISGGDDDTADANFYIYDDTGSFEEPTNVSTAFGDGKGFAMYFFNNTTNGSSTLPVTIDATGAEPTSDVVVDMYSGATGRYTLVGNPFATNVDLSSVGSNIAISNNAVFWDNAAGSYTSVSKTGGLVIGPFQGYWQATGASTAGGQLTFGTSDKTTDAVDQTHFDKAAVEVEADLVFNFESSYNTEKDLKIQFRDDANFGWDLWDLTKLTPLIPNYISAGFEGELEGDNVFKSIESLPINLEEEVTLPLKYELVGEAQSIKMSWAGMGTLPDDLELTLHDYELNTSIDMRTNSEYSFEAVSSEKQKVNPLSLLNGIPTQTIKLKGTTNRFGITIRPTSVSNENEDSPLAFTLEQNYPNPFNPSTTISYSLETAGAVNISVYNLMGQKVATLVDENKSAGQYNIRWNAANVSSGMYYYRLEANGQSITRKMTLIK